MVELYVGRGGPSFSEGCRVRARSAMFAPRGSCFPDSVKSSTDIAICPVPHCLKQPFIPGVRGLVASPLPSDRAM